MVKIEKILIVAWAFILPSAAIAQTNLDDPIPGPIPIGPLTVELDLMASGLAIPTDLETANDGSGRLFVSELGGSGAQGGKIYILKDSDRLATPFLDLSKIDASISIGDAGLTSFTFHPDFAIEGSHGQGKLYTVSAEVGGSGTVHFGNTIGHHQGVLYEWTVSETNPDLVDLASRREILRVGQPRKEHNLNDVAFGDDGYLYLSLGDGGNRDAQSPNSQNTESVFGSILRIDVDDTTGNGRYAIPSTNPFAASTGDEVKEIFAYGLRNSYRMSFDRDTDILYAGDVGQSDIEEINRIEMGKNYGWNEMEGSFKYLGLGQGVSDDLSTLPDDFDAVNPLGQYDHDEGRSVTGGFVYRGTRLPHLEGQYIFGDFTFGRLFHMDLDSGFIQEFSIQSTGAALPGQILGFGQDEFGELYLVGMGGSGGGVVMRLVPEPTTMMGLLILGISLFSSRRRII